VIREVQPGETGLAAEAMLALRPHVGSADEFVRLVDQVQRPVGYRLIGFFVEGREQAVAAAGFRVNHYLGWGHCLYCDDLSTLPEHRGHGYAAALLDWMIEEARRLGCDEFHLDSGVGPDRESAHRLYFNKRMRISAYHFSRPLT
jgi:GNAT superfamily N-acetyltransferase